MRIVLSFNFSETYNRCGAQDWGINYLMGLLHLGHDVYLIEEVHDKHCFDSGFEPVSFQDWMGRHHFERLTSTLGLWHQSCLIYNGGQATHGLSFADAITVAESADLLLNFAGRLKAPEILERIPCRAYVDRNPGTEQVYNAVYGIDYGFDRHHYFFTHGLNVGAAECAIPTCGRTWHPTMVPVVLSLWPFVDSPGQQFNTVTGWGGRETFDLAGQYSGEKGDEWSRFVGLPQRTSQQLGLALDFNPRYEDDLSCLRNNGWHLTDARQFRSAADYRAYIVNSKAEFTVVHTPFAKYKIAASVDRLTRYTASGRPVLCQSMGLESHIPIGDGVLTFSTIEEAVDGIDRINSDYPTHCRAARAIAEDYFDSDKVLSRMLRTMGF